MSIPEALASESDTRPGIGRRIAGIAIDWSLSLVISSAFFADAALAEGATSIERILLVGSPLATLGIWALQHFILVSTLGTTIGHRILGIKVVHEDGPSPVGPLAGLIRTALLALVLPAIFTDVIGRGYHDRAARTQVITTR